MLHVNVEELMKQGHSPDEIIKMISDEIYAKAEQEAARVAAEKAKKEEKEAKAKKEEAREAVVTAFKSYLTLVLGEEIHEDIIRASIVELEQSIDAIKTIAITVNGNELKNALGLFL